MNGKLLRRNIDSSSSLCRLAGRSKVSIAKYCELRNDGLISQETKKGMLAGLTELPKEQGHFGTTLPASLVIVVP